MSRVLRLALSGLLAAVACTLLLSLAGMSQPAQADGSLPRPASPCTPTSTLLMPLITGAGVITEPPLPPPPPPPPAVQITVPITTYGWQQALYPSQPEDPIYPYPRLDGNLIGPPASRVYTLTVLENEYVRVAVLPEIGGRILYWEDKVTGRRLTYANPVIKPTRDPWGYRRWWMATGGIEWAFPVNEHGLNEWRPWQSAYTSGQGWRSLTVWDREDRTGMVISVTLTLRDGRSDLLIQPLITNSTPFTQSYQFWINAMLTLSPDNRPSRALRFWLPAEQVIIHSTSIQTPGFPPPGSLMSWPVFGGVDYSRYGQWRNYMGLFAAQSRGAMGAYDEDAEQGAIRIYPPGKAPGGKYFGLGELKPEIYTDDSSAYFEMWGGINRTFSPADDAAIGPGDSMTWQESWYPIHNMGMPGWADAGLAASLEITHSTDISGTSILTSTLVDVGLHSPLTTTTRLSLLVDGLLSAKWEAETGPAVPFHTEYTGTGERWTLQIWREGVIVGTIERQRPELSTPVPTLRTRFGAGGSNHN